jgi:hypothetical protein
MTVIDTYTHFTVWNMNGGPLSQNAQDALSNAIQSAIKEIEEKDGTRLLWASGEVSGGEA